MIEPGLQFYVDQLNNNHKFSTVRMGNGEWDCILDLYHQTRSKSQVFNPELRAALSDVVNKPRLASNYYMMMRNLPALEKDGLLDKVERYLINKPKIEWHLAEVFSRASALGELYPLVSSLGNHRTVIVGPSWLTALPFSSVFIPIEPQNCWDQVDEIAARLSRLSNAVISISAGPTAKVLIHRLFPVIGDTCWLLDMGSLWDPYCGVRSRKYHKLMDDRTLQMNLYNREVAHGQPGSHPTVHSLTDHYHPSDALPQS